MANVKEVEWQGGIYNIADEVARGEAQTAHSLANTAQTSANAAQTTANAAQTDAGNAQTTANAAQTAVSALSPRVENIESTLAIREFQIPTVGGLPPEQGYNIGVKSGNVVSISVGIRATPIANGTVIAILPEFAHPRLNIIKDTIKNTWATGSHVEITSTGFVVMREAASEGVFFSATYIS